MSYTEHLISMAGGDGDEADHLAAIQTRAEKQASAHAKMIELNGGVGMLGYLHPDMFADMLAWDDLSDNGHADTVIALLAVVREQRAVIERVEAECAATDADSNEPLQADLVQRIRAALTTAHQEGTR